MNKDQFLTLSPTKRVEEVNRLLKNHSLKEIAMMLGFAYSTFTTDIRNEGEYKYNKKKKQYMKADIADGENTENNDIISFIAENGHVLRRVIEMYQSNNLLLLDERVYSKKAPFENKSIKMNKEIYKSFSDFCDTHYPHLKLQDLIAQALLDFSHKYKR